jgi:hypothetical protein
MAPTLMGGTNYELDISLREQMAASRKPKRKLRSGKRRREADRKAVRPSKMVSVCRTSADEVTFELPIFRFELPIPRNTISHPIWNLFPLFIIFLTVSLTVAGAIWSEASEGRRFWLFCLAFIVLGLLSSVGFLFVLRSTLRRTFSRPGLQNVTRAFVTATPTALSIEMHDGVKSECSTILAGELEELSMREPMFNHPDDYAPQFLKSWVRRFTNSESLIIARSDNQTLEFGRGLPVSELRYIHNEMTRVLTKPITEET